MDLKANFENHARKCGFNVRATFGNRAMTLKVASREPPWRARSLP
jgi:hypothetical protein